MADNYAYFYNSKNGDRVYDADSMTDWLNPFFVTGVFNGELQVIANNDMTVTVKAGYCNIGGKVKNFFNETTFDIETASGTLDRIDTVILRRNDTDRDIQLLVVTGGYSSTPSPTALVRSGAYYDLKLAEIYVTAGTIRITQAEITDTRANADVCGWVCSTVKEIDFEQITAQFNAYFAQYQEKITTEFKTYVAYMTNLKEQGAQTYHDMRTTFEDYIAQHQEKITADFKTYVAYMTNLKEQGAQSYHDMLSTFGNYQMSQESRFNNLYEEMCELIGEATAANLQNQIDIINAKIGTSIEDLATKLAFKNATREDITGKKFNITNEDTGKTTVYTYTDGKRAHLTEHGNYTIMAQDNKYYVIPRTFKIDYTQTTETLSFDIYIGNGYVGGYVGGYVTKGNQ